MTMRAMRVLAMGTALFISSLVAGAGVQSCGGGGNGSDAGTSDVTPGGPCQNGTIQLLNCLQDTEAGTPVETFSDEACTSLLEAETRAPVTHDATRSPTITAPMSGQTVPGTTPFTFTWMPGSVSFFRHQPAHRAFTFRDDLGRWATLIPAADAHCVPFNGAAYAAVFSSGSTEVLRAETAHTYYTPTAAAWAQLKSVHGTLSFRVEVAQFDVSVVTTGPWDQTTPTLFTISP